MPKTDYSEEQNIKGSMHQNLKAMDTRLKERRLDGVTSCFSVSSRDTCTTSQLLENMADEHGRKWDRCLADTALKTG